MEIDRIAAEWAIRIDTAPLEPADEATLEDWLSVDIRHRGSFARAQAVLLHAHRAKALGPAFDADRYLKVHGGAEHDLSRGAGQVEDHDRNRRRFLIAGGSAMTAIAASSIVAIGLGLGSHAEAFATKRGEMRLVPLADGSQMTLNTATSAKVRFDTAERRIDLDEGEALFDVAKDRTRPFLVVAGQVWFRAIGTSFTVRREIGKPVQLLVREGVVEIDAGPAMESRLIAASSRVSIGAGELPLAHALSADEVDRELAWREGKLSFEDQALTEAAGEFARYNDRHIVFSDPSIGRETITGLYSVSDPEGFARSASLSLGLRMRSRADGILLSR